MIFGKKKKRAAGYVIMDGMSTVLAKGSLEKSKSPGMMRIRVSEGNIKGVLRAHKVQLSSSQEDGESWLCRVVDCDDDDIITLQVQRELKGSEARLNLRMPVYFKGYLYPLSGPSKVRVPYQANDLSGGGISFYCAPQFAPGDEMEIVIPVTRVAPLLLKCQVLRQLPGRDGESLYACKFVDIIDEQESMVREAVFNAQLKYIHDRRAS